MKSRTEIGVVGPCAAGKTTLTAALKKHGISAKPIAQEHSYVPDMWRRVTNPRWLIFLDASYPVTVQRRRLDWSYREYEEEQHRLRHARQHADLVIYTDSMTPSDVLVAVVRFLDSQNH